MIALSHPPLHAMSLSIAAVEKLVNLFSRVSDPSVDRPIADRKRCLFEGIASLIQADAWVWGAAQVSANGAEQATVIMMDGGWDNERERAQVLGAIVQPRHQPTCTEVVQEAINRRTCITCMRQQLFSDVEWWSSPTANTWREAGYDEFLVSVAPGSDGEFNWIGYHRKLESPPFEEQERLIAHAVFSQSKWLRASRNTPSGCDNLVKLSPRERQVLLLLLGGDSRKQVASKLKLSPHTVSDHLKEIYRKLGVVTRAELLSKFIPGGVHAGAPEFQRDE
jgi:DNA-binding CsgD family transcriptional regulator